MDNPSKAKLSIKYWAIPTENGIIPIEGEEQIVKLLENDFDLEWEGLQGDCGGGLYDLIIHLSLIKDILLPLTLSATWDLLKIGFSETRKLITKIKTQKKNTPKIDIEELTLKFLCCTIIIKKISHQNLLAEIESILNIINDDFAKMVHESKVPTEISIPICTDYDFQTKKFIFREYANIDDYLVLEEISTYTEYFGIRYNTGEKMIYSTNDKKLISNSWLSGSDVEEFLMRNYPLREENNLNR